MKLNSKERETLYSLTIGKLPNELLWEIMLFSSLKDIFVYILLEKRFYNVTTNDFFWRDVFLRISTHRSLKQFRLPLWCVQWKERVFLTNYVLTHRIIGRYLTKSEYRQPFIVMGLGNNEEFDYTTNVCLLGCSKVGKKSLFRYFPNTDYYMKKVKHGYNCHALRIYYKRKSVMLSIYSGRFHQFNAYTVMTNDHYFSSDEYKGNLKRYLEFGICSSVSGFANTHYSSKMCKNPLLNHADIYLFAFDMSDYTTLDYFKYFVKYFMNKRKERDIIFVGCKSEMVKNEHVDKKYVCTVEKVVTFLSQMILLGFEKLDYIEVSVKQRKNIYELFDIVARKCHKDISEQN